MKNENYKNLLEVIKQRKPLIMDLGDNVLLHMNWNYEKGLYQDEMGYTTMNVIQDILKGKVYIQGKKVEIKENKEYGII